MTEIDELTTRLRRIEDEREVARLIASYGPAVDAGDADGAARLWAIDGIYDVEDWQMKSQNDVRAMVSSDSHRNLVSNGCCHFIGPSVVTVAGDSAVAVAESLVLIRDGQSFRVWRATANHFEFRRVEGHWRITKRTSRVLNGDPGAHTLLAAGVAGATAPEPDAGEP
ncbi:hypothetical protein A5739_15485 [Mycobacterium colombiense]|uniref:nuclear transport factor 2 family protein n=1 Tax=Mycobacterium colombiense TaxID=339268 RepID=UPI00096F67ED|nr:nuclear transport factor 2 family protein [Mycobacterium colombiense]OMB94547.1 hypothetical protein A5732_13435 [Mycobacterium colombiense]OMC29735.1 hypothetical protein A5739_15485 [Mycobacterium colombiense]